MFWNIFLKCFRNVPCCMGSWFSILVLDINLFNYRYHLGTVALGSLITLICEFIAGFLKRIKKTLKSCRCCYYFNPIACICYCCFQLFLNSFFRAIKHLNSNAYIISAAYGTDFLTSASNASDLLMKNLLRVYAINKVISLYLTIYWVIQIFNAINTLIFLLDI